MNHIDTNIRTDAEVAFADALVHVPGIGVPASSMPFRSPTVAKAARNRP